MDWCFSGRDKFCQLCTGNKWTELREILFNLYSFSRNPCSRALVTKWNNPDQPWSLKQLLISNITKAQGGLKTSKYLVLIERILQWYIWHPRMQILQGRMLSSLTSMQADRGPRIKNGQSFNFVPGAFPLERTRLSIFTPYYKIFVFRHRFFSRTPRCRDYIFVTTC